MLIRAAVIALTWIISVVAVIVIAEAIDELFPTYESEWINFLMFLIFFLLGIVLALWIKSKGFDSIKPILEFIKNGTKRK